MSNRFPLPSIAFWLSWSWSSAASLGSSCVPWSTQVLETWKVEKSMWSLANMNTLIQQERKMNRIQRVGGLPSSVLPRCACSCSTWDFKPSQGHSQPWSEGDTNPGKVRNVMLQLCDSWAEWDTNINLCLHTMYRHYIYAWPLILYIYIYVYIFCTTLYQSISIGYVLSLQQPCSGPFTSSFKRFTVSLRFLGSGALALKGASKSNLSCVPMCIYCIC